MAISKAHFGVLIGGIFLAVGACSASQGSPDDTGLQGTNGYPPGTQLPPGSGTNSPGSGSPGDPNSGGPIFGGGPGSGSGPVTRTILDGGCPALRTRTETITIYKDASVTDTITTYKPVALFIMQDRSSSMVSAIGGSSAQSWSNSTGAVTAFVNDPRSQGIDIGLGVFPPMQFSDIVNQGDCAAGSDCGQQMVPIASLPGNAQPMIQGYNNANPQNSPGLFLTPTECALRGMINTCLNYMATSQIGEQCVAILVTDGSPTTCDQNTGNLVKIVADGHAAGVTTFTLGLPGSNLTFLDQLAQAGGTTASIDVTGGADKFIAALNNIRQAVSVTMTTHTTTPMVIASPLPCKWGIPDVPQGTTFDKTKVNVQFSPPNAPPVNFGFVNTQGDCARATGDAWYYEYDAKGNPTSVVACPNTCNGTLHNAPGAEVDVLFGCDTIPAKVH